MTNILKSLFVVVAVAAVAGGATWAYFSDTETSNDNTFAAGSLDLKLDGGDVNVVKFTVNNMVPGNQPKGTYRVENAGSVNGYLDLESVSVTNKENSCVDPESTAGDTTCDNPGDGQGELQDVVNVRLFEDNDCDGWIGTGETVFYNDKVKNLPGNFERNLALNVGQEKCITAIYDWWSTADDNKAQGDSMVVNVGFELGQTVGQ